MTRRPPLKQHWLAVANLKGGVGKSTTVMMIGDALSALHALNVLLVDLDPQANLSQMILGYRGLQQADASSKTITKWVRRLTEYGPSSLIDYIISDASGLSELKGSHQNEQKGRLSLIPSTPELRFAEMEFDHANYARGNQNAPRENMVELLGSSMHQLAGHYDAIIFDCPPGFTTLAQTAIYLSDTIISPVLEEQSSIWSLKAFRDFGLQQTLNLWKPDHHRVLYTRVSRQGAREEKLKLRAAIRAAKFETFDTAIRETSDAHKWTYRPSPDSYRSFNSKYGSQRHAVRSLGEEVMQFIKHAHAAEEIII